MHYSQRPDQHQVRGSGHKTGWSASDLYGHVVRNSIRKCSNSKSHGQCREVSCHRILSESCTGFYCLSRGQQMHCSGISKLQIWKRTPLTSLAVSTPPLVPDRLHVPSLTPRPAASCTSTRHSVSRSRYGATHSRRCTSPSRTRTATSVKAQIY